MKRILYTLLLALTSISAMGQTLTVAPVEAIAGEEAELVVTAAGVGGITALQFNLSLPEGVTFSEGEVTKGAAVNDHTLNVQTLANGDRLFILYNMNLNRFSDGELLRIPVNVIDDAKTGKGRIYAIRTSTIDAVSYSSKASEYTITVKEPVVSYKLIYMIDGKEYKSYVVEYGSIITPETAPTKEGYTFSGWSEIPATMPAKDVTVTGTFSVNSYKLTYMVDGKEYKSSDVEYGSTVTPETAPAKEGYTFSGWSEIPATMPAKDVTVTGTFSVNSYKLTYMVDSEEYKSYVIEYGSTITPESEPKKEGYIFSGWSIIPATMPAKDVTITGTFSKGQYKVTYIVDGVVYKTIGYDYEAAITPEAAPTKEGYTFSGWSEIPATMPAKDVTVTGSFTVNSYKLTYMVDDKEYKSYDVEYGSTITPESEPKKEGYIFSGWSEIPETMPAKDVVVTGTFILDTTGIDDVYSNDDNKEYYDLNGVRIIQLNKGINIIKMSDGSIKKIIIK